jgi:hypothetical protein
MPLAKEPPLDRNWKAAIVITYILIALGFVLYGVYVPVSSAFFVDVIWFCFWTIVAGMGEAIARSPYKVRFSIVGMLCLAPFIIIRLISNTEAAFSIHVLTPSLQSVVIAYAPVALAYWMMAADTLTFLAFYFYYIGRRIELTALGQTPNGFQTQRLKEVSFRRVPFSSASLVVQGHIRTPRTKKTNA